MNGDWFLARHLTTDGELSEDQKAALVGLAMDMVRSGLSAHDWLMLSNDSREIFAKAGDKVWAERAALMALMLKNPVKAAQIIEGDDAAVSAALDKP
jgi:hypothetical protein